jgi:VCBS repeat-containing protein
VLEGLAGNDTYVILTGADQVIEAVGGGNDLVLTSTSYALLAGQEVETLSTSFHAGTASIGLTGNNLSNTLIGNYGNNLLTAGLGGADRLIGLQGHDTYRVWNSGDTVVEAVGEGNDRVEAFTSYTLTSGQEIEELIAGDINAQNPLALTGNEFGQFILGNAGRNLIDGKGGNDTLQGGFGIDTFAFTTALGANNIDHLTSFSVAEDEILLSSAIFTGIAPGRVAASQIAYGPAATTADQRIVYDPATGNLYYDADGCGGGAAQQFGRLDPGQLNVADLKIYVEGPNHAPVANPDQAQVDKGAATATATGNVLSNDTDADGNSLFLTAVNGSFARIGQQITGTYGKITINADGSYSYVLNRNDPDTIALGVGMSGVDSFTYEISDGRGGFSSSTLAINVLGAPQPYTVTYVSPDAVEGDTGTTPMVFTIRLDRPAEAAFVVNYAAQNAPNLAGSAADYVATSGQIVFAVGQQEASVTVQIVGDTLQEGYEFLAVNFSSTAFGGSFLAYGTIIDDETHDTTADHGLDDLDNIHGAPGDSTLWLDNDSLVTTASLFSGFEHIIVNTRRNEDNIDGHTYSFTLDDDNAPDTGTVISINALALKPDSDGAGPQIAETLLVDTSAVTAFTVNVTGSVNNDVMRSGALQDQGSLGAGDDIVYITSDGNNDRYFLAEGFDTVNVTAMTSVALKFEFDHVSPQVTVLNDISSGGGTLIDDWELIVASGQTVALSAYAFTLNGANAFGINLDSMIQGAGGYVIETGTPVIFGAAIGTYTGPLITYGSTLVAGELDFSQMDVGVVINPGQTVQTTGGAVLFGASLVGYNVLGTGQDDHIDRTDAKRDVNTGQQSFFLGGGNGNDYLRGGNWMEGGAGNDTLVLDSAGARATGGDGADTFVMHTSAPLLGGGTDPYDILDYVVGDDTFNLYQVGDLALGQLSASAFVVGSAAGDADDRIIYNSATGALYYDADGNGAGAAEQFATVGTGLALTASEFFII